MPGKRKPPETNPSPSPESEIATKQGDTKVDTSIDERDELDPGVRKLDAEKEELKAEKKKLETKLDALEAEKKELETKLDALEAERVLLVQFGTGQATATDLNTKFPTYPRWTNPAGDDERIRERLKTLADEKKIKEEQLTEVLKQLTNISKSDRPQLEATHRRIERLEMLQNRNVHSSQLSRPVSRSESYAQLCDEGLWKTRDASTRGIQPSKPSRQLASVFDGENVREEDLQRALSVVLTGQNHASVQWSDTHVSGGNAEKPDFTCAPNGFKANMMTAVGFIELKSGTVSVSTRDCLGQIAGYLHSALENQSNLEVAYGVVASWREAVAVVARREDSGKIEYYQDPVTTEPAKLVSGMIKACRTVKQPITVGAYRFGKQFGKGSSCEAYTVVDASAVIIDAVGKTFADIAALENEVSMLSRLNEDAEIKGSVPRILASDPEQLSIVVSPRGRHFRCTDPRLTWNHAQQLLKVLFRAHSLEIVHCDVRPANFFCDREGQAFLNDWSSAFNTTNSSGQYNSGSLALPDGFRIPNRESGPPSPRDDLYSFILSCYVVSWCDEVLGDVPTHATQQLPTTDWWSLLQFVVSNWGDQQEISKQLQGLLTPQNIISRPLPKKVGGKSAKRAHNSAPTRTGKKKKR